MDRVLFRSDESSSVQRLKLQPPVCAALRVHGRSSRYRCQGAPENSASRKIRKGKKEKQKKQKEAGTRIKEALAHLRDRRTLREREKEIFYICFRKKVFLPRMHHSVFRKHGSFLPPEAEMFHNQTSFSFCWLKNSDSKSNCKLLSPDIVFLLQLLPKFPAENLNSKSQLQFGLFSKSHFIYYRLWPHDTAGGTERDERE